MREKSTHKESKPDYKTLIPEYDDNQILEILKKRNYYQPEAADLAVKEAKKRGLIHSEQDLFAEEYRFQPLRFHLFPTIEKTHQMEKIRKSIARALIITGIFPVVWGVVRIYEGKIFEGSMLLFLGALWTFLSYRIFLKPVTRIIQVLFFMLALSVVYVLMNLRSIIYMDIFILVFLYGLIVYGLLFILRMKR